MRIKTPYIFWLTAGILIVLALLWPGDAPWINDEPHLISNALQANNRMEPAKQGILGSFGIKYGPLATWIYQIFLLFTHDLVAISFTKNALTLLILVVSMYLMADRLNLVKQPILLILISPYIYFYNRILWDNCFLIPVSALLFLCYVQFSLRNSIFLFYTILSLCVALIHIHMMSLFLIVPLSLVFMVFNRKWFKENRLASLIGILLGAVICVPYLSTVVMQVHQEAYHRAPIASSLLSAVSGAKFFSFVGFGDYFLPEIYSEAFLLPFPITLVLLTVTGGGSIFFFLGIIDSIKGLLKLGWPSDTYTVMERMSFLCLACLLVSVLFFLFTRHQHHPHYFNATWFSYFFFCWQGIRIVLGRRMIALTFWIYFAGIMTLFVCLIVFIHRNGGNRSPYYGATLSNQIRVAKQIGRYPPSSRVVIKVKNFDYFIHALNTLIRLYSPMVVRDKSRPPGVLTIDYRDGVRSGTGWIVVNED